MGVVANRGLIVRSWNAQPGSPVATPRAAVLAPRTAPRGRVELIPPPGIVELRPGDFVEAEVELVVMPVSAEDYYGADEALRRASSTVGTHGR